MASIAYLLLDANYDPVFADNTALTGAAAVSQAIQTELSLFLGQWWEDLSVGLPVFQSMLGQLGSQRGLQAIQMTIQAAIKKVPYVTSVDDVRVSFVNGVFKFSAIAQTAFGPVPVGNLPGASAGLGG